MNHFKIITLKTSFLLTRLGWASLHIILSTIMWAYFSTFFLSYGREWTFISQGLLKMFLLINCTPYTLHISVKPERISYNLQTQSVEGSTKKLYNENYLGTILYMRSLILISKNILASFRMLSNVSLKFHSWYF